METITTTKNIDQIINLNNKYEDIDRINGWVFGRVDYTLSSGLDREDINREEKVTKNY